MWEKRIGIMGTTHTQPHTHTRRYHIPCPMSTKLAIVFAALEDRKKLAFRPSLSAEEKVL